MRRYPFIFLALFFLVTPAHAASLQLETKTLGLGQAMVVRACLNKPAGEVSAWLNGRRFPLDHYKGECWSGPVAVDLKDQTGPATLKLTADGHLKSSVKIRIVSRDYGARRITVKEKFMKLTPAELERYRREIAKIKEVYATCTPRRLWSGGFEKPVDNVVVSTFGKKSFVNGVEKSPHGGIDLRGGQGDPVKAAADGRVALVLDTYFGGLTILLDHGKGLVTSYLHLSASLVEEGQLVSRGETIAEVGATGRVTGPHLHFGVILAGCRISPLDWIELSGKIPSVRGDAHAKK